MAEMALKTKDTIIKQGHSTKDNQKNTMKILSININDINYNIVFSYIINIFGSKDRIISHIIFI